MSLATEAQLDFHPMPRSAVPTLRDICRYEGDYGNRPGVSIFIARPGQSVYCMADGREMTSGHHMSGAGYFVRPCDESRGWDIHSLHSRKLAV